MLRCFGPFDPIETLRKARQLREKGIASFIPNERSVILVSKEKRFDGD
jgi:hypothetical protein